MACTLFFMPLPSHADDEFYGTVEHIPDGQIGTWIIGGRKVVVTEQTELGEDDGTPRVGTCVEVEHEGKIVEEIKRQAIDKCEIML